jgi:hypothetical protein
LILDATVPAPVAERARFVRAVSDRLAIGDGLYGDDWALTPFDRLLAELIEEALDLAAWAVLADQRLDMEPDPPDTTAEREALLRAIRCGAAAFAALNSIGGDPWHR